MYTCAVCQSTLELMRDGSGGVCPRCKTVYSAEALRRMAGAQGAPSYERGRTPAPSGGRVLPEHHIQNEQFGLSLAEHRQFAPIPKPPRRPEKPTLFAPRAVKDGYAQHMRDWEAEWGENGTRTREKEARERYFKKFFEPIAPEYTAAEWSPYFEGILMESFPEYGYQKNVSISKLPGVSGTFVQPADFVLTRNGRPVLAIFLMKSTSPTTPGVCKRCAKAGLPALAFRTWLPNRRDYVTARIGAALNP